MAPDAQLVERAGGFGVFTGLAVANAGPRRERSGKARTAGESGSRAARRAALKTYGKFSRADPAVRRSGCSKFLYVFKAALRAAHAAAWARVRAAAVAWPGHTGSPSAGVQEWSRAAASRA